MDGWLWIVMALGVMALGVALALAGLKGGVIDTRTVDKGPLPWPSHAENIAKAVRQSNGASPEG